MPELPGHKGDAIRLDPPDGACIPAQRLDQQLHYAKSEIARTLAQEGHETVDHQETHVAEAPDVMLTAVGHGKSVHRDRQPHSHDAPVAPTDRTRHRSGKRGGSRSSEPQ